MFLGSDEANENREFSNVTNEDDAENFRQILDCNERYFIVYNNYYVIGM